MMTMKEKMLLHTERLTLVPLSAIHYETTRVYSTDPENTKMMCFLPCDSDEEVMDYLRKCDIQWSMEKPEYLDAAIILNGTHIGAVSIEFLENRSVGELGWIINRNFWGNGYAAEAASAFMRYIQKLFGLSHYIAHADEENSASLRVMEKIGMKPVKTYSGRKNRGSDEIRNECLYELTLGLD